MSLHKENIAVCEDRGLDSAPSLYGLGLASYLRGVRSGSKDDLREATALLRRAYLTPTYSRRLRSLCYLALALSEPSLQEFELALSHSFEVLHSTSLTLCDYVLCGTALGRAATGKNWFTYPDDNGRVAQLITDTQEIASAIGHPYEAIVTMPLTRLNLSQPNLHPHQHLLETSLTRLRSAHAELTPRHILYKDVTTALSRVLHLSYEFTGKLGLLDEGIIVMRALLSGTASVSTHPSHSFLRLASTIPDCGSHVQPGRNDATFEDVRSAHCIRTSHRGAVLYGGPW